ncbi:MAG TPA: UrcA family protein [Steroidobacteraceae bacterium]|nr:UrcA family protein [Steroidobacteraceae bacterium]
MSTQMTTTTLNPGGLRTAVAFTVLGFCTAIGAIGSAHAASADAAALTVRYSDLNLSTQQGARVLYGRIVAAAHRVCAGGNMLDLDAMATARVCREEAIAKAVRDVNSPMLASVHAKHRGTARGRA